MGFNWAFKGLVQCNWQISGKYSKPMELAGISTILSKELNGNRMKG
jgi:hypothetical protein